MSNSISELQHNAIASQIEELEGDLLDHAADGDAERVRVTRDSLDFLYSERAYWEGRLP